MDRSESRVRQFDVAVVGGGPAGATISALLARRGRRVVLIDKDLHPRFHIGESLLPKNLPIFERLGLAEEIARIGVLKPGVDYLSPGHDTRQTYLFADAIDPSPDYAYQVRRSDFDKVLLRHAVSAGAALREGWTVTGVDRTATGWMLRLTGADGPEEVRSRYLIDASGRDGLMARQQKLRHRNRDHNSAALFAHFEGVSPDAWSTPGNISIFWFEHGWIWMIPLSDGVSSVGAVCMPDYLRTRKTDLERFFDDTLRLCPRAWAFLTDARKMIPVRGAGNYAYRAEKAFGDGYLLVGDAYAFVDPVFSTGVLLAMSSAERAAPIVEAILDRPADADRLKEKYQRDLDRAIRRVSWFIYRFNTPALVRVFMASRNILGARSAVISLLAGDLYRGPFFDWRLAMFKLIYEMTRRFNRTEDLASFERRSRLPAISMPENDIS